MELLTARPSVGSYRAEPLSIADIDAHPECDRIWATISDIRDHSESEYQRGRDDGEEGYEAAIEEAAKEGRIEAIDGVDDAIHNLLGDLRGEISEPLAKKIKALTEGLS
ncbi:MAG: hypothetical protein ACRCXM_08850 [Beijerinckiaceae bacterium]